jgi:hypothetical protein
MARSTDRICGAYEGTSNSTQQRVNFIAAVGQRQIMLVGRFIHVSYDLAVSVVVGKERWRRLDTPKRHQISPP